MTRRDHKKIVKFKRFKAKIRTEQYSTYGRLGALCVHGSCSQELALNLI